MSRTLNSAASWLGTTLGSWRHQGTPLFQGSRQWQSGIQTVWCHINLSRHSQVKYRHIITSRHSPAVCHHTTYCNTSRHSPGGGVVSRYFHTTDHSGASKHSLYRLLAEMPKKVDVKGLQQQRTARRQKVRKYPPATVYLQVLGSGALGAPRALYVFTEHARYLFNCGEGTQRLAYEHKVKLSMTEHILVTHKSWLNVGGLPGVLLTLQDTGVPSINVHGPPGIDSLYYDTRSFLRFRDLEVNLNQYSEATTVGDESDSLQIQAVPIWGLKTTESDTKEPDSTQKSETKEPDSSQQSEPLVCSGPSQTEGVEDLYAHERVAERIGERVGERVSKRVGERRGPGEQRPISPHEELSRKCRHLSLAYICRPPAKAGALRLEACVRAGVKPGPLLGELKRGNDVTLPDGRVVRAADVTEPDDPGPVFIVVEVPHTSYLDSLLACESFTPHQAAGTCDADLAEVVVHFTKSAVMADQRYQQWMARFSPSTTHMILNDSNTCLGSEAVYRIQHKLNHLDNQLFPLLQHSGVPVRPPSPAVDEEDAKENVKKNNQEPIKLKNNNIEIIEKAPTIVCVESENVDASEKESLSNAVGDGKMSSSYIIGPTHQARTLMTYHIRPRKRLDRTNCVALEPAERYIEECYQEEGFKEAIETARTRMADERQRRQECSQYPNVIFLGTGSCIPNKTRNTSGILVNISPDQTLLMDCGEGTYGQLVRLLGLAEADRALRNLRAVYVSHLHADHHIGLIRLLHGRRGAFYRAEVNKVPKVHLLAPSRIRGYLTSYNANFEPIMRDFSLTFNHKLLLEGELEDSVYENLCEELGMARIEMTFVEHCPNSFGVAWTHRDGWKMVYSGDTMPCGALVDIGKDCDLLIHEATMEDELEEEARIKTHSTTSQAIQVGRDMNAKHILLTHFSQRYAKVPLLDGGIPANVAIAFDNMKVSLHDVPTLGHCYAALEAMFAGDVDEMREKTAKKRQAKELLERQLEEVKKKKLEEGEVKRMKV